jgi:hypothetical protein
VTAWLERAPREPVVLERAFEAPAAVRALVPAGAPYWPTLRYVANEAELAASGGDARPGPQVVMPWFRGDWAYDEPRIEGAERILATPAFVDAARAVFDAEVVRPRIVYVNLMVGIPFAGPAHIDVPAFRGIDRTQYPVWLLHAMNRSGLFEPWRVDIATAVAWFYEGEGGDFEYWPRGPGEPPQRITTPLDNRAVVGDNDVMFHRVGPVGPRDSELPKGDGVRAELSYESGEPLPWAVVDDGRVLARHADRDVRVSVSWKAEVFSDAEAARIRDEHTDDLPFDAVIDAFVEDLRSRGIEGARPVDALADEQFTALLAEIYALPGVREA